MTRQKNTETFGISLPNDIAKQIDELRGDVSRSRFILRLIEKELRYKLSHKRNHEHIFNLGRETLYEEVHKKNEKMKRELKRKQESMQN